MENEERSGAVRPEGPWEVCEVCGFDSDLYGQADTISSQSVIAPVLAAAAEGLQPTVLEARPDDSTWSIIEYIDHVRETAFGNRMAIEMALTEPGVDLGDPPNRDATLAATPKRLNLEAVIDGTREEFELMGRLLDGLTDDQWTNPVVLGGERFTVGWFGRHVLHDGLHHLGDVGRIRQRLGHRPAPGAGSVAGLHISDGGVPKIPVESVAITSKGVGGDSQHDRRHHGRPFQAVSLWSSELIASLQDEGHPIRAGAAGENITVAGLSWSDIRPGTRIDVGSVPMLVTAHAIPCAKNAQWFSDRDFKRIHHDSNTGSSRLYALPLTPGDVTVGDPVIVEPDLT